MTDKKVTLDWYCRETGVFGDFVAWITELGLHKKRRTSREWSILQAAWAAAESKRAYEVPQSLRDTVQGICDTLHSCLSVHRRPDDGVDFMKTAIARLAVAQAALEDLREEKQKYLDALSAKTVAAHRKAVKHGKSS